MNLHCDPARLRTERGRPIILGHRGMPGDRTENRMAAFRAALKAGADGVELDVRSALDDVPVVAHDATLERVAGRAGRVADFSGDELADMGLPSLEAVLEQLAPTAIINIEIKGLGPRNAGLERAVRETVGRRGAECRVLFSSFNPLALARLEKMDPLAYAAQLTGPGWGRLPRLAYLRLPMAVHPHLSEVSPRRIAAWRARGRRVIVWGANSPDELALALNLDLDGIITDNPAAAVKVVRRRVT